MENRIVFTANGSSAITKILYTGKVHTSGGREGVAKSTDGRLDISLSTPGTTSNGTNPEQLFAAGWSACFIGAMQHNAISAKIKLPEGTSVNAEVDLGTGELGFALQARLQVNLPGLSIVEASSIVEAAHQTCPYSKLSKNNINIEISVAV